MQKTMILALTILSFQTAFADGRDLGRGPVKNESAVDVLRRDIQRLNDTVSRLAVENTRLLDDNRELRRQLEEIKNDKLGRPLGFFTYAGCQDFKGKLDLNFIISSEGRRALESETIAKQKVASTYNCAYGIIIGKTEEIRFSKSSNYCVAGCKDFSGKVDPNFIQSASGRNVTEAQYVALKAVSAKFNCSYGVSVQSCQ